MSRGVVFLLALVVVGAVATKWDVAATVGTEETHPHERRLIRQLLREEVKDLLRECLGREPIDSEVDGWKDVLDTGKLGLDELKKLICRPKFVQHDRPEFGEGLGGSGSGSGSGGNGGSPWGPWGPSDPSHPLENTTAIMGCALDTDCTMIDNIDCEGRVACRAAGTPAPRCPYQANKMSPSAAQNALEKDILTRMYICGCKNNLCGWIRGPVAAAQCPALPDP